MKKKAGKPKAKKTVLPKGTFTPVGTNNKFVLRENVKQVFKTKDDQIYFTWHAEVNLSKKVKKMKKGNFFEKMQYKAYL